MISIRSKLGPILLGEGKTSARSAGKGREARQGLMMRCDTFYSAGVPAEGGLRPYTTVLRQSKSVGYQMNGIYPNFRIDVGTGHRALHQLPHISNQDGNFFAGPSQHLCTE